MRASTSEAVVKTVTKSDISEFRVQISDFAEGSASLLHKLRELRVERRAAGALIHLQQDHRHVVVLRRLADKRRDLAQHPLAQLVRWQVRMVLDQLAEAVLAEAVVVHVHRLADAVRKEEIEIAGVQLDGLFFEDLHE